MKKVFIFIGLLLFSCEIFAGTCSNSTVATSGGYSFSLTNIGNPNIGGSQNFLYYAGRMIFSGSTVNVSVTETQSGNTRSIGVTGTYSVASNCLLTINFSLPSSFTFAEKSFTVSVYLDRMNSLSSANTAYHGNATFKTNLGMSGVGVFDRGFGKF